MFHVQKSLLFCSNQYWVKRNSVTFDVTIWGNNGAKICELVGIFILSLLSKNDNSNSIGLYLHDSLSVFINGGQLAEKHKDII